MLDKNYEMKNKIMRRVYLIWFFRKIISLFALEIILFLGLIVWMTAYVSFADVYNNAPSPFSSPSNAANFFTAAFFETELASKIIFTAVLALIAVLAKQTMQFVLKRKDSLYLAHQ